MISLAISLRCKGTHSCLSHMVIGARVTWGMQDWSKMVIICFAVSHNCTITCVLPIEVIPLQALFFSLLVVHRHDHAEPFRSYINIFGTTSDIFSHQSWIDSDVKSLVIDIKQVLFRWQRLICCKYWQIQIEWNYSPTAGTFGLYRRWDAMRTISLAQLFRIFDLNLSLPQAEKCNY